MIKAAVVSLGILILCGLENLGHYFGFCFHGWMSSIVGTIGLAGVSFALYLDSFQKWLMSRNSNKPHKCKDHNHDN